MSEKGGQKLFIWYLFGSIQLVLYVNYVLIIMKSLKITLQYQYDLSTT